MTKKRVVSLGSNALFNHKDTGTLKWEEPIGSADKASSWPSALQQFSFSFLDLSHFAHNVHAQLARLRMQRCACAAWRSRTGVAVGPVVGAVDNRPACRVERIAEGLHRVPDADENESITHHSLDDGHLVAVAIEDPALVQQADKVTVTTFIPKGPVGPSELKDLAATGPGVRACRRVGGALDWLWMLVPAGLAPLPRELERFPRRINV